MFEPPVAITIDELWIAGLILAFISIIEAGVIIFLFTSFIANKGKYSANNKKSKAQNLINQQSKD